MNYAWERTAEPSGTPVLLEEMKDHLRVDHEDDDALIHSLLYAATAYIEDTMGRSLVTQTWQLTLDRFPPGRCINLPMPPLVSVTSIKYTPTGDTEQTFAAANYSAWTAHDPGKICLTEGSSWPTAIIEPGDIVIEYVAGAARESIPESDKLLIKLVAAHWYEHREAVVTGTIQTEIGIGFDALLNTRRSLWYKPW